MTRCLLLLFLSGVLHAQTFTYSNLLNFPAKAKSPGAPIVDMSGNIYGVSQTGGSHGFGAVFKVSTKNVLSLLYSFGSTSQDGTFPNGPLVMDSAGNLYGVTDTGGAQNSGIMFEISPKGKETILYNFQPGTTTSNIYRDSTGTIYGYNASGYGELYQFSNGQLTTLYQFCFTDPCTSTGDGPQGMPVENASGIVYGEVDTGAAYNCGAIFQEAAGSLTTLYTFDGGEDGCGPWIKPTQDSQGNLYGITYGGGANNNGVVFKVDPSGIETVLYDFPAGQAGSSPLVEDAQGNWYGIAGTGKTSYVYMVSPTGQVSTVLNSPGAAGLGNWLAIDSAGNLYGTTMNGGPGHYGNLYKLTKQ